MTEAQEQAMGRLMLFHLRPFEVGVIRTMLSDRVASPAPHDDRLFIEALEGVLRRLDHEFAHEVLP